MFPGLFDHVVSAESDSASWMWIRAATKF
uniref:Uncharacterized protein n=1 Tax=Macrostomum lignano TaxID=282301 RepID=A0A1I8ISQ1_9PLAT